MYERLAILVVALGCLTMAGCSTPPRPVSGRIISTGDRSGLFSDLGTEDGVKNGDVLHMYRGETGEWIGRTVVRKACEHYSILAQGAIDLGWRSMPRVRDRVEVGEDGPESVARAR